MDLLEIEVQRGSHTTDAPHHVRSSSKANWSSLLSPWTSKFGNTSAKPDDENLGNKEINPLSDLSQLTGFQNPWPSWHKPTRQELWNSFEWGDDQDPCIDLAVRHIIPKGKPNVPSDAANYAAQLLSIEKPDFDFDHKQHKCKITWLGHAGILLQLPPLPARRPFRCLFDPFFSMRCSPSQLAGPIRSYRPPCRVEDLPEVDVVMISHDHYDHLDYDTIMALWKANKHCIRFVVPLKNAAWFTSCGIPADRVFDLDWWDSLSLRSPSSTTTNIQITCTPSQHNSGRGGVPPNSTLWSSWFVEYKNPVSYKIYFAGDTGYQFHDSPTWPPSPSLPISEKVRKENIDDKVNGTSPICPAFQEITQRLGSPHVCLLPVSVGATYDYFRSFVPLTDSINPFPRHRLGVTAANHMPPWDAVRVFRLMAGPQDPETREFAVAIAMHWGTFVTNPVDILKTLGQLEFACKQHDVGFARTLSSQALQEQAQFLALNHGQSIAL